jgi:hypothetical protein
MKEHQTKKDNRTLKDYTNQFKIPQEVIESHLRGSIELIKFISTMKEYNPIDPKIRSIQAKGI